MKLFHGDEPEPPPAEAQPARAERPAPPPRPWDVPRGEHPERPPRPDREARPARPAPPRRGDTPPRRKDFPRAERPVAKPGRAPRPEQPERPAAPRARRPDDFEAERLIVSAGRRQGVRPADIVGALTRGAGVHSAAIGAIELGDDSTLVELHPEAVEDCVRYLRREGLRGQPVAIKRQPPR